VLPSCSESGQRAQQLGFINYERFEKVNIEGAEKGKCSSQAQVILLLLEHTT
jgi:hypothetical protein